MGLIPNQDRRAKDWAYIARFDKKDLPSLEEMARHIRETHDTNMIEDFNQKCEQKLKIGQSAILVNGIELKAVTKTGDLVVNGGLDQCIRLIQGTSTVRWSHFGFGATGGGGSVTDTALYSETIATRTTLAWTEPVGMRLLFGGISSQTDGTAPNVAVEIGVYNGSAAGATLLNRSGFASNRPDQEQALFANPGISTAPIVVSAVIEFCPVA